MQQWLIERGIDLQSNLWLFTFQGKRGLSSQVKAWPSISGNAGTGTGIWAKRAS
ncbi:hypothetical protein BGZ61DRAFT_468176 [Ilyonectria robusta]|uniref:uncharacterized protein n=1 Tax=Ilyonectria robusta TaxID=1079257 RepID=UPI001E8CBB43|nr:uncharacterized protein BGZ61DRAFT_468176 [Ilyonectria robusta]KAH8653036.1 hypothetical protein BGZ61DRAFT_468176 [Ilyonectria robusta]